MTIEFPPYDHDDAIIQAVRDGAGPQLAIRRVLEVMAVLGRASKVETELHLERCLADGVPVLRRRGGGCAVVLDPGNLVISLVLEVPGFRQVDKLWRGLTGWLLTGLEGAGLVGLYQDGICDLVLADRKVGGAAMYRARGLVYYSTTLLLSPQVELMERYLSHPPREPAYRRGRRHREFVGGIGEPPGLDDKLREALKPPRALGLLS